MPVEWSEADFEQYGYFNAAPSPEQLRRYFVLDDHDLQRIALKKGKHNRLGYALQLTTLRFLGTFLADPLDIPPNVISFLARQLRLQPKQAKLERYRQGQTKWDHRQDIQQVYGYRVFSDPVAWIGLIRFLTARTRLQAESPSLLLDRATARLYEHKVILPGVTTLARLIARVQERSDTQLWASLAALLRTEQRESLIRLLDVPPRSKVSTFEHLRQPPISVSAQGLVGALKRVERIRKVGVQDIDLSPFPAQRLDTLFRIGLGSKAQLLRRMTPQRQLATLLVTVSRLEGSALDDALTLLDSLLTDTFNRVERHETEQKLASLPTLEEASRRQNQLTRMFLDHLGSEHHDFEVFSQQVLNAVPKDKLEETVQAITTLTQLAVDFQVEELLARYSYVQQFVPTLLHTVGFEANRSGQPLLAAIDALKTLERRKKVAVNLPLEWAKGRWEKHLRNASGEIQRSAYTLGVLEYLHLALKRRDLYVPASRKFDDPRRRLLSGQAWSDLRTEVCRSLDLDPEPAVMLARMERQLSETYHLLASRLPQNAAVTIEELEGKSRLVLQVDEAQEEPASLRELQKDVTGSLPRVDVPDLLLEVHDWTAFADECHHLSERRSRVEQLPVSVCAVLLSEACNVGLESVTRPEREALRKSRLNWVSQNYVRAETIAAANARLVDFQSTLPGLPNWGRGHVASVDGMRFRVPVKSIYSGQNPRYFGVGSGVTYLNFVADQFTSFHGIVVPGTLRDSLYALDGLLEQNTALQPRQLISDTGASSYMIFGLFSLLGYQFSPQLADLPERRYWRLNPQADYGPLNAIATNHINTKLIARHWDDLLRIAGSLLTRQVRASDLIKVMGVKPKSSVVRALEHYGRISYTQHLLTYHDDPVYRRVIGTQRNRQEARHRLGRALFQGERGELRQHYVTGMEDQLGALGLVMNAIIVWNSKYISLILEKMRSEGRYIDPEDARRLSPLKFEHIHLKGRYHFSTDELVRSGKFRKLRDPDEPED